MLTFILKLTKLVLHLSFEGIRDRLELRYFNSVLFSDSLDRLVSLVERDL